MTDKNTRQQDVTSVSAYAATFDPTPAPPTLAVIDSLFDDVGVNTGNVAKDGLTDDLRPTLNGHMDGAEGMVLKVWFNGVQIGTTTVDDNGHWTFTPDSDLSPNQEYYAQVSLLDPGSDAEFMSLPLHFYTTELDKDSNVIPDAATDLHLIDNYGPIQGEIASNGVTDDTTPTFSGKATAGDVVIISDNGKVIGSVTAAADGSWSITPELKDGSHSLSVVVENPDNGAKSAATTPIDFIVSTRAEVPVISGVIDDVGEHRGLVANGGLTDDKQPKLQGSGEPGSTITLTMYGPVSHKTYTIAHVKVGADGHWEYQFTGGQAMQLGNNVFHITETDLAGNTATGVDYSVQLVASNQDVDAPDAATNLQIYDDVGKIQGYLINGSTTDDSHPTISGQATADDIVLISDNGKVIGSTTVDAQGNWSFTPTTALDDAAHSITAVVKDSVSGKLSDATEAFNFTVDSHADMVSGHEYFEGNADYSANYDNVSFASGLQISNVGDGDLRVVGSGFMAEDPNNSKQTIKGDNHENSISNQSGDGGLLFTLPGAAQTISFDYSVAESVTVYDTNHNVIATLTPDYDNGRGTATIGDAISDEYSWCHFEYTAPQGVAIGSFSVDSGFSWVDNVRWSATDSTSPWSQATDINNEAYNLTNHAQNTLALSYNDVLSHAKQDLYIHDGKEQLAIKGDNGDVVQIKADFGDNAWSNTGSVSAGGVQYDVYQHSGGTVEMLIQHGVELHQVI